MKGNLKISKNFDSGEQKFWILTNYCQQIAIMPKIKMSPWNITSTSFFYNYINFHGNNKRIKFDDGAGGGNALSLTMGWKEVRIEFDNGRVKDAGEMRRLTNWCCEESSLPEGSCRRLIKIIQFFQLWISLTVRQNVKHRTILYDLTTWDFVST